MVQDKFKHPFNLTNTHFELVYFFLLISSLNQHSFGCGAMHLCTNFGAMPLCTNFGAQMAWNFKSAQFFESLHFFKSAQFWLWCNTPMHQLWCNAPLHQLWCTNDMEL